MIYTVISLKGSQTKSTTGVNYAACLDGPGYLLDWDEQQKDATRRFSGAIPGVEFIKELSEASDGFVVIDTAPQVTKRHGEALLASDFALILFVPEVLSLDALKRSLEVMDEFAERNPTLDGLVVPVLVSGGVVELAIIETARALCRWPVSNTIIPRRKPDVERALIKRVPVVLNKPDSPVSVAYRALAQEIKERIHARNQQQSTAS